MKSFFYIIEGVNNATQKTVEAAGLSDVLPDFGFCNLEFGPEGVGGCTVARSDVNLIGYYPAEQEWRKLAGRWIGWRRSATSSQPSGKDALPGPQELSRDTLVQGRLVTLGDGREWLIPIGRTADGGTNLPTDFRLIDATGEFGEVVKPAYKELRDLAENLYKLCKDENPRVRPTGPEYARISCRILAINYRVREVEVSLLGLLNAEICAAIVLAYAGIAAGEVVPA